MSKSKFDPLDMALNALAAPTEPEAEEPTPDADKRSGESSLPVPSITRNTAARGSSRRRSAPAPTAGGAKTQLNIYVPVESAADLRQAVVDLGQQHSLGDLVARLINDHLAGLVVELGASATTAPARLRGGRKVTTGVTP